MCVCVLVCVCVCVCVCVSVSVSIYVASGKLQMLVNFSTSAKLLERKGHGRISESNFVLEQLFVGSSPPQQRLKRHKKKMESQCPSTFA